MKVPTLKELFEVALRLKKEQMAPRRKAPIAGYDERLDDLYNDSDEEEEDLRIHHIG